jgi:Protein of unknown function (DUF1631)
MNTRSTGTGDFHSMTASRKQQAQRTIAIIRDVKSEATEKLHYLFDGLAANVADALFEEMWGRDEQEALEYHFNVMRALRVQSVAYRTEFDHLMSESWVAFLRGQGSSTAGLADDCPGKVIRSYRNKIESRHKMLLNDIRLRLSGLLKKEVDNYPLCPEILYINFWCSTGQLDLNYSERLLLLPLFDRFVMDRYGQLLGAVNKKLIEHSIQRRQITRASGP